MRTNQKLVSNMIYSGLFQLLYLIIPVITIPYVARVFSPAQLGIYATSYAVTLFLIRISSFGIPLYGTRAIAQAKTKKEHSQILLNLWLIQILATLLIFISYSLVIYFFMDKDQIYLIQGLFILTSLFDISWFFNGIEEIKRTLFRNVIAKMVTIILIFTFVKTKEDLGLYTFINILGILVGNLSMIAQIKPFVNLKNLRPIIIKKDVNASFQLLIPQAVENGKNMFPRVLVGWLSNYKQAGFLDQGMKITTILSGIFSSIVNAMIPRLSYLVANENKKEMDRIISYFTVIVGVLCATIISGTLAISQYFVPIFFGPGYDGVILLMNVSILSIFFSTFSYFFGQGVLLAYGHDLKYQRAVIISGVSSILFCILFIKPFGGMGGAIAYVVGEFVVMALALYHLRKTIDVLSITKMLLTIPLMIGVNYSLIFLIKNVIDIYNNFLGFLLFGSLSVIISLATSLLFLKRKGYSINQLQRFSKKD